MSSTSALPPSRRCRQGCPGSGSCSTTSPRASEDQLLARDLTPAALVTLRLLQTAPGNPQITSERAALYRSLVADRRILVVLDNAGSADQVRPLLPGGPSCAVVVTSRDALAGLIALDGAIRLDLSHPLPPSRRPRSRSVPRQARHDAQPALTDRQDVQSHSSLSRCRPGQPARARASGRTDIWVRCSLPLSVAIAADYGNDPGRYAPRYGKIGIKRAILPDERRKGLSYQN
jgi:hypothetical protein